MSIDLPVLQDQEVRIQGSAMYTSQDVSHALGLIRSGRIEADLLVTAVYDLLQAARAFAAAQSGQQLKVHITVGGHG